MLSKTTYWPIKPPVRKKSIHDLMALRRAEASEKLCLSLADKWQSRVVQHSIISKIEPFGPKVSDQLAHCVQFPTYTCDKWAQRGMRTSSFIGKQPQITKSVAKFKKLTGPSSDMQRSVPAQQMTQRLLQRIEPDEDCIFTRLPSAQQPYKRNFDKNVRRP